MEMAIAFNHLNKRMKKNGFGETPIEWVPSNSPRMRNGLQSAIGSGLPLGEGQFLENCN
jgi:hypothetical protein